jgi:hypothetical protein
MQPVVAQVTAALIPLVAAVASWALYAVANWLRTKARTEYERGVIARLTDAVETVVRETQQTTVADIKAAAEDGTITEAEAREIRDSAIARTKAYLGKTGVADLKKVFDSDAIEGVIKSKIEAQVHELKTATPPVPVDVVKTEVVAT